MAINRQDERTLRLYSTVRFVETIGVSPEEKRLIEYCRQLNYGELTVKVKDGLPVMIHKAREDVKLTVDNVT